MLVFGLRGKPEKPGKNLLEQSREPTNSIHVWQRVRESNARHIGGRWVLSPLCQPWSPNVCCVLFLLHYRYILYLVYVSFCKCDIITQFAVHLYDCTLYERSLQLNCFHIRKWFLHTSKIWANKSLHVTSLIWKKTVAGHGPGWSSSLFVFEDFNGDIGNFLPWNTEHCKSSEFMLKAEI